MHHVFPDSIEFPATEVVVRCFAIGQVVGHLPPRTACPQNIEDAIDDFSPGNDLLGRIGRRWRDKGSQPLPLRIGQIRWIALSRDALIHQIRLLVQFIASLDCLLSVYSWLYEPLTTHSKALHELKAAGVLAVACELRQSKYLNNLIEQDHRFIKRLVKPGMGFFSFEAAWRTIQGYEAMHMMRKGQVKDVDKGDILCQVALVSKLFGAAA